VAERVTITGLGTKADGIAEGAHGPLFVPYALPGETVAIERSGGRAQLVGIETAKRLTFTADEVSGSEAVALGLAGSVSDSPYDDAHALAGRLAERRPEALAAAKRLFDSRWSSSDLRTFASERWEQARLLPGAMSTLRRMRGSRTE
jgi:hypothetical protein